MQRVARQIAGRWWSGGWGPRSAVMTAVLREAGLNQYPDIERVSDTLTIPDPGCHTSERASERALLGTGTRNGDGECAATDNDVRED